MTWTEACFCGRYGALTDREPVVTERGPALRCPVCGDLDHLTEMSESLRLEVWTDAKERELAAVPQWGSDPAQARGRSR